MSFRGALVASMLGITAAAEEAIIEQQNSQRSSARLALILVTVVIASIGIYFAKRDKRRLPPTEAGWLPIIGAGPKYLSDPEGLLTSLYAKFGDCFSLKLLGHRMTILSGNDGAECFFKLRGEEYFSACEAYRFTVPIFGKDVVYDCHPDILVEQKRFVKNSFTNARFRGYISMIAEEVEQYFAENWGDEGERDIFQAFNQVTVLTSVRALQGDEVRSMMSSDFQQLYADLDAALTPLGFFFPNAPLPGTFRRDKARAKIESLFMEIIRKRRQNPDNMPDDLMTSLLQSEYKDGRKLQDYEVIGLLIGLLLAGQHTSNVTSTWTGLFMHHDREILKRVLKEQAEILGNERTVPTFEDLKAMKTLDHCIKETLRMRPPLVMLERKVVQDTEFKGYVIPKGSFVAVSPLLNHQIDSFWSNPKKFDPDRFARGEHKNNRFSYFPFGAGRHQCSGQKFGYLQVKSIWSTLFRLYDFEFVGEIPPPDFKTVICGPSLPCMVRYKRRNRSLADELASK